MGGRENFKQLSQKSGNRGNAATITAAETKERGRFRWAKGAEKLL